MHLAGPGIGRLRYSLQMTNPIVLIGQLNRDIISCNRCPRLLEHCQSIAMVKRRAYLNWEYWGKPVPGFGDPFGRLLILGLAPGAHGANRTGRMFTGDNSGRFLYDALQKTGFSSQSASTNRNDGLTLNDCYITAAVRCAPPQNRPTSAEFQNCQTHLVREYGLLPNIRVVIALGHLALKSYLNLLITMDYKISKSAFKFSHGAHHKIQEGLPELLCSYHPSQQNTQTKRLTKSMLVDVLHHANGLISG